MRKGTSRCLGSALILLLPALLLAGCVDGNGPSSLGNPLPNPKLILYVKPDGGFEVYVHGAVRERAYDRIEIIVDNVTRRVDEYAYASVSALASDAKRLRVTVEDGTERYVFTADLTLNLSANTADLRDHRAADTDVFETVKLPWSKIIAREETASS